MSLPMMVLLVAGVGVDKGNGAPFKDRIVTIWHLPDGPPNRSEIGMLADGKRTATYPVHGVAGFVRVAPDGRRLAYSASFSDGRSNQHTSVTYVMDADGKSRELARNKHVQFWTPDGKQLVCTEWRERTPVHFTVSVVDGQTSEMPAIMREYALCGLSPNGREFLAVSISAMQRVDKPNSTDFPLRHICRLDRDGSNVRRVSDPNSDNIWVRWSPDRRRISFHTRAIENDRVVTSISVAEANGEIRRAYATPPGSSIRTAPVWSPDGKRLAWMEANVKSWQPKPISDKKLAILSIADGQVEYFPLDDDVWLSFDWQ